MERVTVPFSLKRYAEGYSSQVTTHGVVRLEADALVIEFRETTTSLMTLDEESGAGTGRLPANSRSRCRSR